MEKAPVGEVEAVFILSCNENNLHLQPGVTRHQRAAPTPHK